ncbi:MAG: SDR family NAD(P)-dependent oxidoreductase [Pseudomonadales bacterium]|nr:SDR family NAD(P)-dependent oxidoreductase [Pseudomonadales bacterium]
MQTHSKVGGRLALVTAAWVTALALWCAPVLAQEGPSMAGKTVLVTGSTDGMGREVAQRLGTLGAHVLVHGRNAVRGAEVVDIINAGPGSAQFYQADLGSLQQVRDLAAAVMRDHQQLHLLINNAGIASGFNNGQKGLSEDGYEMIFQVNYLSHYLLTDLLLPLLKRSAPARIVNVASGAQRPINFEEVFNPTDFDASAAYAHSKLAQILHTFHKAEELEGSGVTFNTLHPATMMDTTMVRQMGTPRTTVDEGATALMNLAVGVSLEGRSGLYFNGLRESRANAQAYDRAARAELDALARRLTGG